MSLRVKRAVDERVKDWPLPKEMSRGEFIELWRRRDAREQKGSVSLEWDAKQGRMVLRNH